MNRKIIALVAATGAMLIPMGSGSARDLAASGSHLITNEFAEVADNSVAWVDSASNANTVNMALAAVPLPGDIFLAAPEDELPEVIEPTEEDASDLFADDFVDEDFVEEEEIPDVPVEDGSVPPVIDRPLGLDDGIQIIVNSFVLDDARDLPEYGISIDEIHTMLEAPLKVAREGMSIGKLQQVAEQITDYYRSRGLILAQAVLPVQDVQGGEVHFQVFEGIMGRVLVEDNKMYAPEVMQEPFEDLVGRPVVASQVESALLQLTEFPGLTVFGLFQPGEYVGEADLVLKVQDEERFRIPVRLDNQGTESTGEVRIRGTVEINNPTKSADRLSVTWQEGYSPDNQQYWSVNYQRYMGNDYTFGVSRDSNTFQVGGEFADRNIRGVTTSLGFALDKQIMRSRQENLSFTGSLTSKESRTFISGNATSLDQLSVLGLTANYDSVDTELQGLNFATFEMSFGFDNFLGSMGTSSQARRLRDAGSPTPSRSFGGTEYAAGKFTKAFLTYTRLQTIANHHSILFRTDLQWSQDLLVPLEQYSVGGPDSVRAFPVAEVLWDKAMFASVEYLIDAPFIADGEAFGNRTWGELLQFSIFYDAAAGELNRPNVSDQQGTEAYRGFGTGLRLNVPGSLSSRLMVAWPIGKTPGDGESSHIWADFTIIF